MNVLVLTPSQSSKEANILRLPTYIIPSQITAAIIMETAKLAISPVIAKDEVGTYKSSP